MNNIKNKELITVREGEDFNREAVKHYLQDNLDIPDGPMSVKQFAAGSSNLTYLIQIGNWEAVLRRPPSGPLPPKAHDMQRESNLLMKIYPQFNLVPKPFIYCDDESVIGVPFYVMERKNGVVLDDEFPEGLEVTEETRRNISETFIKTLIKLHQVDYKAVNLESFGYPEGFVERQVKGWTKRYLKAKTDDIPEFDRVAKWVQSHIPESHNVSIIHNDYKLNNILLTQDFKNVSAVFDWEMATIAEPLFDLGVTLGYWIQEDDPEFMRHILPTVTFEKGFYTRRELIERYATETGLDVSHIHFYIVFSYFRLAGVLQQIYYRYKTGQTNDHRFATFNKRIRHLLQYANDILNKQSY